MRAAPLMWLFAAAVGVGVAAPAGTSSAFAEPWRAWAPLRAPSPAGPVAQGSAAGKDLEVGVAIGVPNPPPVAPFAPFGSTGWYPVSQQPAGSPSYISTYSQKPSVPQTFQTIQPLEPVQPFQPYQTAYQGEAVQPLQMPREVQYGSQPMTFGYQAGPLRVQEWEGVAAQAPPPPPPPLLRAPATGALLAPTPYSQRRVGAFRLRSDRGYQLTMEVPPAMAVAPGAPPDGVLVMDMGATLYRPVG